MKYRLFSLLCVFFLLAGCSAAGTARELNTAADTLRNAVYAAPAATPSLPAAAGEANLLTREEAEQIALDYAGFTADQVKGLRTEFEVDNGIRQYDVEFYKDQWEYEFEIHAETGEILSYDRDNRD